MTGDAAGSILPPPPRLGSSRILWLGFGLVLAFVASGFARTGSVTMDDSFIVFRVVENWAAGHGPRFNLGDPHFVVTSPLWFALLATAKTLLPSIPTPDLAQGIAAALLALGSLALFDLLRQDFPAAALLAPGAVFFAPSMPSLAGHDTACALACGAFLLWAHRRGHANALALAAGAFYLARGEGAVLGAVLGFHWLAGEGLNRHGVGSRLRRMGPGLVVAAILVGAWHLYHVLEFGGLFPATLAAKIAQGRGPFPSYLSHLLEHLNAASPGWAAKALVLLGWLALALRRWPLALWPLLHVAIYAGLGVPYYHWYYYPLELVVLLALVAGAEVLLRGGARALAPQREDAAVGAAGLALAVAIALTPALRAAVALQPPPVLPALRPLVMQDSPGEDRRFLAYQDIAGWVNRQPAVSAPVLLAPEIGILGYLLPEAEVRDVVGLASPDPDPRRMYDFPHFIARHDPDYLVMIGGIARRGTLRFRLSDGSEARYRRVYVSRPGYLGSAVFQRVPAARTSRPGQRVPRALAAIWPLPAGLLDVAQGAQSPTLLP